MAKPISAHPRTVVLQFHSIRNISSPEDLESGRRVLSGHAPIQAILPIPTNDNVRDYLLEAEGKQRARPTQVHRAIVETLKERPSDFSVLNGGIVIVAREVEIDEKQKSIKLTNPSIINGSQTQGVLRDFLDSYEGNDPPSIHVKFEIIVTDDDSLIAEISIARNFQNDVMAISIAGRRGQLNELEESLQKKLPNLKLRKTETEIANGLGTGDEGEYVATEKLLQVIAALVPVELSGTGDINKVYTYSRKAQCLKEFQEVYKSAKDTTSDDHRTAEKLYEFYLDICAQALQLYGKWKTHAGFKGTRLRSIERDGSEIVEIPDGIIFPILASLSAFAKKTPKGWVISPPTQFNEDELIKAAKSSYIEIANSNPQTMGKSKACYSALLQITSLYRRLTD